MLVISQDVFNERSGTVIALVVTSQEPVAGFPLTLEVTSVKLPKRSWVKISQIRTLSTERVGSALGRMSPEEMEQVKVLAALLRESTDVPYGALSDDDLVTAADEVFQEYDRRENNE